MCRLFQFFLIITLTVSCSFESKDSYISNFDSFVTRTSANYKGYDEKAWVNADTTFVHFQNRDYQKWESKLTPQESARVNELIGKYQALKIKAGINQFNSGINGLLHQADSFIKELTSDSTTTK